MSGHDQNDWEDDPVWNLVDKAKLPEAGPFFVRNVMREIRRSEDGPTRWWQRLFTPKPLLIGALGAAAAVVVLVNLNPGRIDHPGLGVTPPADASPVAATSPLDELLKEEMLFAAAENPAAFTDEALLELLH